MSDAISTAFCDLSEISCHWGLRRGLFNSAGDCHVPKALVTVSSCFRTREMYLNKRVPASLVGNMYCTAPGGGPLSMPGPLCLSALEMQQDM